jgi:hypothetical protein
MTDPQTKRTLDEILRLLRKLIKDVDCLDTRLNEIERQLKGMKS